MKNPLNKLAQKIGSTAGHVAGALTARRKNLPETDPNESTAQPASHDGGDKSFTPPMSQPLIETPNPERQRDRTKDDEHDPGEEPFRQTQLRHSRVMVICTFFIALATIAYMFFAYLQWREIRAQVAVTRGQLESMIGSSGQTERLIHANESLAEQNRELVEHSGEQAKASLAQAEAAKQSVGAAQSAARAAQQGAQIAQQSFYIGDRPYVSAVNASIDKLEADMKPRVDVYYVNTGKTPALDVRTGGVVSVGRLPKPPDPTSVVQGPSDLIYPFADERSGGILLGASEKLSVKMQGVEALSKSTVEEIKNGNLFLFVWGAVMYKDGLGKPHGLLFCLFYEPHDDLFVACPEFNKIK
jgi:hypothetical protein